MHAQHRFDDILGTIGATPVVRINRIAPEGARLYAKIEAFNPMGSVKDRMARHTIERAERDGSLRPGMTVVEATSGNTGIGLAMVCAAKGYPLVLVMAESFSVERRRILRFLGARVVLTPAELKGTGMLEKATELADAHGWFLVRQFENEANADAHTDTTALEILDAFADEPLDYFVTGFGTGGTLKGVGRVLRDRSPNTKIVVCEPDNSPILGSGIPQPRNSDGTPTESHPLFRPHLMQGWSPDFIPKLTEDAISMSLFDEVIPINGEQAIGVTNDLAKKEGIFVGISSGATMTGALEVCRSAAAGSTVLCMLPDTGERYLSTPLFEEVPVEMTEEEIEISRSTPAARFDAPARPAPAATEEPVELAESAVAFVDQVLADGQMPVVMFALEWCEFCWAARKMFKKLGLDYRSIDLDSVEYQKDNRGGEIRAVLRSRLGTNTIPQVWVGSEHIGGCTDLFDAWREKRLQALLEKSGISTQDFPPLNPEELLPKWRHSR